MSVFKAAAHVRELKQRLSILLPSSTISESSDTDTMPTLTIQTGTEYQNLKISVDGNQGRVDGLGLSQRAYSPHVCQLIQESAAAADAAKASARAKVLAGCAKLGMKITLQQAADAGLSANWTAAVAAVAADSGATTIVLPSDEINPLTSSQ
jgi:hypothetical protein